MYVRSARSFASYFKILRFAQDDMRCHSEERSDEESCETSLFLRSFASLRMTYQFRHDSLTERHCHRHYPGPVILRFRLQSSLRFYLHFSLRFCLHFSLRFRLRYRLRFRLRFHLRYHHWFRLPDRQLPYCPPRWLRFLSQPSRCLRSSTDPGHLPHLPQ